MDIYLGANRVKESSIKLFNFLNILILKKKYCSILKQKHDHCYGRSKVGFGMPK